MEVAFKLGLEKGIGFGFVLVKGYLGQRRTIRAKSPRWESEMYGRNFKYSGGIWGFCCYVDG